MSENRMSHNLPKGNPDIHEAHFTEKHRHEKRLHCNVVMKVTNERKGMFSFCSHNMNKKFQWEHFYYSGVNFLIKSVNNQ